MRGRGGEGNVRCVTQSCPCAPSEQRPTGSQADPPRRSGGVGNVYRFRGGARPGNSSFRPLADTAVTESNDPFGAESSRSPGVGDWCARNPSSPGDNSVPRQVRDAVIKGSSLGRERRARSPLPPPCLPAASRRGANPRRIGASPSPANLRVGPPRTEKRALARAVYTESVVAGRFSILHPTACATSSHESRESNDRLRPRHVPSYPALVTVRPLPASPPPTERAPASETPQASPLCPTT